MMNPEIMPRAIPGHDIFNALLAFGYLVLIIVMVVGQLHFDRKYGYGFWKNKGKDK